MDRWDILPKQPRLTGKDIPLCDLSSRPVIHQLGSLVYFSFCKRTKTGIPFSEIKQSAEYAVKFALEAISLISRLVNNTEDWAIITTPRRRHFDGFHFATSVCEHISSTLDIPFYRDAVQCINRSRLDPEFHLLRNIEKRNVIVFDDIITTGTTLKATRELLADRDFILNIVGINNR